MPAQSASTLEGSRSTAVAATLRRPTAEDGTAIHDLIARCPPLDENSHYANLIQCAHFADTCRVAELDGEVVGWISGHVPPNAPDAVFCWQVAVGEKGRGQGLAKRLVRALIDAAPNAERLLTTITPDNAASWALFKSVAADLGAALDHRPFFERDRHFAGRHETEELVTIGPLAR